MIVEREFVSIGVNRVVNALAWGGEADRVAYGGHHTVVVYDPETAVIEHTLVGHTGHVNAVLWVKPEGASRPHAIHALHATPGLHVSLCHADLFTLVGWAKSLVLPV